MQTLTIPAAQTAACLAALYNAILPDESPMTPDKAQQVLDATAAHVYSPRYGGQLRFDLRIYLEMPTVNNPPVVAGTSPECALAALRECGQLWVRGAAHSPVA